ncbi:MAG: hypothetical protein IKR48_12105 [Kiritimatiellae bacterium]|nr:hypothetical protein [Kiritimatiellia bacterium]
MKMLKENLKTVTNYATADTTNAENFPAWTPSDAALLEQLAMTGTLGNFFYANAKDATKDAVALLERADPFALAAAIVRGRNEGFIRAFPILGLVYLSKKNAHIFQDTFQKVVLTGNDLVDFIEVAKTVRGLGRSIKTAISGWIAANTNPYYAQKYRTQIADAIRLSRFKGEDAIYAYILNAYSDVKGNSAEKLAKAYEQYPDLAAHRDFATAVEAGDLVSAARILDERNLDVNSLTAYYGKFDKVLWAAVAKHSPVMRFVKYLAKFLREGVLTPELLKAKVNVEALKKAKVFPFRLYTAYLAVAREVSAEGKWVLDHLADVMNDYAQSYDWSVFAGKRWVIAPDVSGSMTSRIGDSTVLTYAAVSAMFVGFFVKGLENVTVLPWDTEVKSYCVPRADSVMTHIEAITRMVYGGTHMETAVNYMLKKGIETDYAVFLTDTEEYGSGWLVAWREYHKHHPKAVAFVLRGDSYMTSPIPESEAEKLNVYQIFGWNDSVIDYMKFVLEKRKKT